MLPVKIVVPDDFLKEEVRNDYLISEKMKKVWAVQLDLLVQFQRVCEENDLSYFAEAGTLLGAVRHKGFIPWDDDIDIVMKRDDYDKLLSIGHDAFKDPYFLQSAYSDEFIRGFSRLRNSNTTAIGINDVRPNCNKGIFIDIFPLDNVPNTEISSTLWIKTLKAMYSFLRVGVNSHPKYYASRIKKIGASIAVSFFSIVDYKTVFRLYEKLCKRYNKKKCDYLSYISFSYGDKKHIWKATCFNSPEIVPFEFVNICIPNGYNERLRVQYGDYLIPKKVSSQHGKLILEPLIGYREFLNTHSQAQIDNKLK